METNVLKLDEEDHALMSPSRLQRILDCPGSFNFTKNLPRSSSSYANRGSFLHEVMQKQLSTPSTRTDKPYVGQYFECDDEEKQAITACLDFLENCTDAIGPEYTIQVEEKVTLQGFEEGLRHVAGTADIILRAPGIIHVIDWKFGKGVYVSVEANDQLMAYAIGAAEDMDTLMALKEIRISIFQPFLENNATVVITPREAHKWLINRVIPGVLRAETDTTTFIPGQKQCRFCPGKMVCETRFDSMHIEAANVFAQQIENINMLPVERLSEMLTQARLIKYYLGEIEKFAKSQLLSNKPFPGYKMVAGRQTRSWGVSEDQVVEVLEAAGIPADQYYKSTLVSPAQAEKLRKGMKPIVAELVVKSLPSLSLVPEDDPRQAIEIVDSAEVFAEYIDASDED
jgi:hypothetical protein